MSYHKNQQSTIVQLHQKLNLFTDFVILAMIQANVLQCEISLH